MSGKPPVKHRYANALSIEVAAAVNGLYRFNTAAQAEKKLDTIRRNFTVARAEEGEEPAPGLPSLLLWMREYELTEAEIAAGHLGNFGRLQVEEQEDGLFTINAYKVEKELKFHPVRKRPATRAPNWGHPVLRGIQKNKTYETLEQAQHDLDQLQLEYPETTIPGAGKLFLMIFSRKEEGQKPLQKYVLEIQNLQGGGFTITSRKNEYKRKEGKKTLPIPSASEAPATPEGSTPGHFASMVALKRKRKGK